MRLRDLTVVLFASILFTNVTAREQPVIGGCGGTRASVGGRTSHSLAYDTERRKVLMFGGISDDRQDEYPSSLWEWDGGKWTCLTAEGPPGRIDAHLAFDSIRKRLVLFGGRRIGPNRTQQHFVETWEWDGRAWTKYDAAGPGHRTHGAIAFDPDRRTIVINGGGDDARGMADSWEWNGTRWREIPAHLPSGSIGNALIRTTQDTVLMVAAHDATPGCVDERRAVLFALRGDSAVDLASPGPCFSPQAPAAATANGLLLYAGWNGPTTPPETWTWTAGQWQRATSAPARRRGTAVAYDSGRQRVVLFGGEDDNGLLHDTWEWNGTAWQRTGPVLP